MVIASPCFLKSFMISFRFLSACGPEVRLNLDLNLSQSGLSRKRPTSSHISAPWKLPIVTSNMLLVFFTQAVSLSNVVYE